MILMNGLLRVYDDGDTFKSKLNWAVIQDNFLNFYEDKKSTNPSSFVNLSGCHVKKILNETYNINMIEIKTSHNNSILLTPDNMKDFTKWIDFLVEASEKFRDSYEGQQSGVTPRSSRRIEDFQDTNQKSQRKSQNQNPLSNKTNSNYRDSNIAVDHRKRNDNPYDKNSVPGPSHQYRRDSAQSAYKRNSNLDPYQNNLVNGHQRPNRDRRESSNSVVNKKYESKVNERRQSNMSGTDFYRHSRAIDTVKEDPMMSDDEVLETKPIEELRRKYPITDKTKRWSIAATDLVGKSNDELFLMLIQLNREKSHMEIWKETLEGYIAEIDEKLKERLSMQTVNELEGTKSQYEEQLSNIEYLINLAHPLISFMDAVVQMSDAYGGNNEAFHVAYHQCPPTGDEDFSNINFIRHNQEKQVAKLINENKSQSNTLNSKTMNSLNLENGSDKENDSKMLFNLNNTEEFLSRKTGLNNIIDEISTQLEELEPKKIEIRKYIEDMDNDEVDANVGKSSSFTIGSGKSSIKNVKSLKDNETKTVNPAFLPRRSTRKAPMSDMAASISRKETLKSQGNQGTRSKSASLRYPQNPVTGKNNSLTVNGNTSRRSFHADIPNGKEIPTKNTPLSATPRSQKSKDSNFNFSDSIGRSSCSNVQNQLRDLMRTDPYEEKRPPSPIYRDRNSVLSVLELESGPLLKLNTGLFQNTHGLKRSQNNDMIVDRPATRVSMSESDVSIGSHRINQRLNLNQFVDDNKHWKNPGRNVPSENSNNYLMNEESDAERKATRLILNLISTPEKMNIGERYRSSITEEDDINDQKSRKMRQLVANESFSRLGKDDGGRQKQRESRLLDNSRIAQEASRKSREMQKI